MSDANQDDESRTLLGYLQYQRDSVLKIIEGLPEEACELLDGKTGLGGR